MALFAIKYLLPALLGYILFVGISGQLMPFSKPKELAERPAWLLGLWATAAVCLAMTAGMHMAYQTNAMEVGLLVKPLAALLVSVLAPGLVACMVYSRVIKNELNMIADNAIAQSDNVISSAEHMDTPSREAFEAAKKKHEAAQASTTVVTGIEEHAA